jgi:hypothetical protein
MLADTGEGVERASVDPRRRAFRRRRDALATTDRQHLFEV